MPDDFIDQLEEGGGGGGEGKEKERGHCKLKLTINANQVKCWFLRRGETGVPKEQPLGAE